MTTRADIVACARTWLGTPYRHQGSVRGVGADCSGLLRGVAREKGIQFRARENYARGLDVPLEAFLAEIAENLVRIEISDARDASVLLIELEPARPYHFAIVTDVGIIHSYQSVGMVVETSLSRAWRERIHSAWDIPVLEDL